MNLVGTALAPARVAVRQLTATILRATDGRDVLQNTPDGWEVTQPWLWWSGPPGGGQGPFGHPIPGASPTTGLTSIPSVGRASSLIVDTLATLPWHVYRGETERLATPDWVADPQALRLDGRVVDTSAQDETRWSPVDFWGEWILSALWFGDGFVYVPQRDAVGAPRPPLWILHPGDVEVRDGRYWVGDEVLPVGSVIHLRGMLPIVNGRGTGVLTRFRNELGVTLSLRDYVAGAFSAGVPAGYLKTSVPNIRQEQADELKARWMAQHGNGRRSIAVLNATTEFQPIAWSPMDLAAVDFAKLSVGQVALMFGVPAYLLGQPSDSATYANVESRMIEFYRFTLLPWVGRIEGVLDAQLPRGTELRVEIDGLLRADTKTRYDTYAVAIDKGILTVDEVRALEARPPLAQELGVM